MVLEKIKQTANTVEADRIFQIYMNPILKMCRQAWCDSNLSHESRVIALTSAIGAIASFLNTHSTDPKHVEELILSAIKNFPENFANKATEPGSVGYIEIIERYE